MIKIYGHELDLNRSSDGTNDIAWTLVFTQGRFDGPGVSKTVEPVQFKLKKKDYNFPLPKSYYVFYNPDNNKYNIIENGEVPECSDYGYQLGGFVISGCRMMFLYPKCTDNAEYIRPFAEEYDQNFEKRQIKCSEVQDFCGAFRDDSFTEGFEIDCPIIEDNNAFNYSEFDPEEFETLP